MSLVKSAFNFFHIKSTDGIDVYVNPHILSIYSELFRQIIDKPSIDGEPLKPAFGISSEWALLMYKTLIKCRVPNTTCGDKCITLPTRHQGCSLNETLIGHLREYQSTVIAKPKRTDYEMLTFLDYIGYEVELVENILRNSIKDQPSLVNKVDWLAIPKQYRKVLYMECGSVHLTAPVAGQPTRVTAVKPNYNSIDILHKIDPELSNKMMMQFILAISEPDRFVEEYNKGTIVVHTIVKTK